jgi:lysophospholipase L1-like esterase
VLSAKGYTVAVSGVNGAGLLDGNVCDGSFARAVKARYHPDVVVIEWTGNDLNGGCTVAPYGSKNWLKAWRRSAAKMQRSFGGKTHVHWMLVPGSGPGVPQHAVIPFLNLISTSLHSPTIDVWAAFGGGVFDPSLRQPDGLHLSTAGAELMAQTVAASL